MERIKAICWENRVRETQEKTDGNPIWEWSFRMGAYRSAPIRDEVKGAWKLQHVQRTWDLPHVRVCYKASKSRGMKFCRMGAD